MTKVDRSLAFREYQKNKEKNKEVVKKEVFEQCKNLLISEVIGNWIDYRSKIEKHDPDTIDVQARKLKQILRDFEVDIENITLGQFIRKLGGVGNLQKTLESYKQFHLNRLNDKSIPAESKLGHNSICSLLRPVNPFFERYLGLDIHLPTMGHKRTYRERVKLADLNKIIDYMDNTHLLKIKLAKTEQKKELIRKRWALERITIQSVKYLWARTKELSEGNLTLGDIRQMKKTGRLPLHTRKRTSNPLPFQQPVVVDDFLEEWKLYENYRDSNDWSDDAPAIVSIGGEAIKRRWVREVFQKYRIELGLSDCITPHNVRRSMHTLCRSLCNNRMIAQIQLGDVSQKIADEHYNIPDTELIKKELENLYHCKNIPGEQKTPMELKQNEKGGDMAYA